MSQIAQNPCPKNRGAAIACGILWMAALAAAAAAPLSDPAPSNTAPSTGTVVALWPGGVARWSDVAETRASRQWIYGRPTPGGPTERDWVEWTVLRLRLGEIAREKRYADDPEFLASVARLVDQRIFEQVYQAEIQSTPAPTDEEIEEAYRNRSRTYGSQESVTFRYIYFDTSDLSAEEKARERETAQSVLTRLRQGEPFSTMALHFSDYGGENKAGAFGPVSRGRLWPEVEDVLFTMNPGELSPLLETPTGYHIVMLAAKTPAQPAPPLSEVRDAIGDALLLERRAARREAILNAMRERYPASANTISRALFTSPTLTLTENPKGEAIRVGPWSMTYQEFWDLALSQDIVPADRNALWRFAADLVDQRRMILYGRDEGLVADILRTGLSPEERERMLLLFTLNKLARPEVRVSEGDIDIYYLQNLDRFTRPDQAIVRHIEVYPLDSSGEQGAREIAERIAAELEAGAMPDIMPERFASPSVGVVVGPEQPIELEDLPQSYRSRVEALKTGEASRPIRWTPGWVVALMVDRSSGGQWPLSEARPLVAKTVERRAMGAARAVVRERLITSDVQYFVDDSPAPESSP